ncbi:MAG: methyltransferase [Chloroflexota bacterium]|nr:methyltransferase [Chloroflexota bacterium]
MHRDQTRTTEYQLGGQTIRVVTRPGFPHWEEISPPVLLFADNARISQGERVLICPCGHGALGVWAARQTSEVTLLDTNIIATKMAKRTLALNEVRGATVEASLPSRPATEFDVVLLPLPKGRSFARLLLLQAFNALKSKGRLYLAGPNRGGIKSVIGDAEKLFGPASVLAYKGGNRIALLQKNGQKDPLPRIYQEPGIAPHTYRTFQVKVNQESLTAYTRPGVFSWKHLDAGTRLLLETIHIRETDHILDIGCGYGIIGVYAARQATKGFTTLVDVDVLACDCARRSVAANNIERAQVVLGDVLPPASEEAYSLILSNPPFHTGHDVTRDTARAFIHKAFQALQPKGRLVIVANRFLPYDDIIEDVFGSVNLLHQTPKYHVMEAQR